MFHIRLYHTKLTYYFPITARSVNISYVLNILYSLKRFWFLGKNHLDFKSTHWEFTYIESLLLQTDPWGFLPSTVWYFKKWYLLTKWTPQANQSWSPRTTNQSFCSEVDLKDATFKCFDGWNLTYNRWFLSLGYEHLLRVFNT